tara:strand:- start:99 stop:980 length:882 start_codon:yes stop_codon:yes gene_type:complete
MEIRRRPPNPSVKVSNLEYAIPHKDSEPRNILEEIIWEKEREVNISRDKVPLEKLISQIDVLTKPKDFIGVISKCLKKPAIIAEIKKASPSKGVIRKDFDPIAIAKSYQSGGASCISVLTDKKFFQGGFDVLVEVRKVVELPILCKDFIILPYQLYQARAAGADAVLFIAAVLSDQDLKYLHKIAKSLEMTVLVEVHNSSELGRILNLNLFSLIGINNRDLTTFKVDLGVTRQLSEKYKSQLRKENIFLVSESGISTHSDLKTVYNSGASAVLVGESLMAQSDIEKALTKLIQ